MPRRNSGPRLRFLEKRGCYYIVWTEGGRSRERSTGTKDRGEAEKALGEFIIARIRRSGPRDPNETFVMDALADYAEANAERPAAARVSYAILALEPFWREKTISEVHDGTCRQYAKHRQVSNGTIRRELSVLRAAINFAVKSNQLTRSVPVWLPERPEARDVWLTRSEFARLLHAARLSPKARDHLPLFMVTSVYTGRRKKAILDLRWANIDLANGTIDFRCQGRAENKKRRGIVRCIENFLAIYGAPRRVMARVILIS